MVLPDLEDFKIKEIENEEVGDKLKHIICKVCSNPNQWKLQFQVARFNRAGFILQVVISII